MAKRNVEEGHEHWCCGPRRSYWWGVVSGVVLALAVSGACRWWGKCCGYGGGMCAYHDHGKTMEKAPEKK